MTTTLLEHAIKELFAQIDGDETIISCDCALVVGDKRIYCHRAIIACSDILSKYLIVSKSSNTADDDPILEINLANDDIKAMTAIVQYCYTNSIQISSTQFAGNLLLAAEKYGLSSLYVFCKDVVAALEHCQSLPGSLTGINIEVPNSSLDLTSLVNDKTTADLVLKTEHEDVHAHKCILLSQVPSLSSKINKGVIEISSQSPESVKRVMKFLYTSKVSTAAQEEVLKDIITAKELHVNELVSRLERIIVICDENALGVLTFAVHNDLDSLKTAALDAVANTDFDDMFESIKHLEVVSEFEAIVRTAEQARKIESQQLIQGISLRGCLGLLLASVASVLMLRMQIENGFFVALTNVCFCCTVFFFL